MKKTLILSVSLLAATASWAQQAPRPTAAAEPELPYRATDTKINALVHTKLDVGFDYAKRHLNGKAWLTLKPYAYATDSLRLDAKGFDIKTVALVDGTTQTPLKYDYADQNNLRIQLGRTMPVGTPYTVYIEYTAKPDELKVKGSAAITDAKGLYFINPDSATKGKPVQIWTQGETEASSAWFPTIDRPNQKTTSEISMTVPAKYVTLSNGRMTGSTPAGTGLRTDTWKMEMPHAPYLFMMAVGDFKIYEDKWRDKPVTYYLEPKYAPFAKQIFGDTPEMMEFFSKRLGVDFPWNKYAQIVARDYVSGAMENTTATLHGEFLQMNARELLDREYANNQSVIAHELFHQWFGDYVTAESWSNLTVNESMADMSEALWAEHKYGKEAADAHRAQYIRNYLNNPNNYSKNLVRFHYGDKEEMFDGVTYQKGGAIQDMLRTYLGDDVYFAGLNQYLKQNALGNGEAHQLRLAMEAASGRDLNWFFNQWYYGAGHPEVTIDYSWDAAKKVQSVTLKQTQEGPVFQLPLAVDVYVNGKPERHMVMMRQATETFQFAASAKPDLVNVDATKLTVWLKKDNKPLSEYVYQYSHAPLFSDRREAIMAAKDKQDDAAARTLLVKAMSDKFYNLRSVAITALNLENKATAKAAAPALRKLAATDPQNSVRANALDALAKLKDKKDAKLFTQQLKNESYQVSGAALSGLAVVAPAKALAQAKSLETTENQNMLAAVIGVYAAQGGDAQWNFVRDKFDAAPLQGRFGLLEGLSNMLVRLDDPTNFSQGVERVKELAIQFKPQGAAEPLIGLLQSVKQRKTTGPNVQQAQQAIDKAVQEIEQAK
ncbi:M1 family metallopeptidase [Hymenobacter cellulosivorans]|uniref:Aminopeptidase N n=1 Tax=Hymenobacter cellulosivorans TaxID=2932249 RepID=A0ABY4FG44_9BACT|nr:M1 family metallopeptidase [Hymenobacter cellulosivorans]UOQ54987.1 HEAT repeat domain-containing protein [Hymenobacter cellulosivorans]